MGGMVLETNINEIINATDAMREREVLSRSTGYPIACALPESAGITLENVLNASATDHS